jgi:hypothetical protein
MQRISSEEAGLSRSIGSVIGDRTRTLYPPFGIIDIRRGYHFGYQFFRLRRFGPVLAT